MTRFTFCSATTTTQMCAAPKCTQSSKISPANYHDRQTLRSFWGRFTQKPKWKFLLGKIVPEKPDCPDFCSDSWGMFFWSLSLGKSQYSGIDKNGGWILANFGLFYAVFWVRWWPTAAHEKCVSKIICWVNLLVVQIKFFLCWNSSFHILPFPNLKAFCSFSKPLSANFSSRKLIFQHD